MSSIALATEEEALLSFMDWSTDVFETFGFDDEAARLYSGSCRLWSKLPENSASIISFILIAGSARFGLLSEFL